MTLTDLAPLVVTETEIHELDEVRCELTMHRTCVCSVSVTCLTWDCTHAAKLSCGNAQEYYERAIADSGSKCFCGKTILSHWRVVPV